ncbi:DUF2784 domain-containing protein [Streptosporangiaceae bacterium NEAU-GS5]|nr:DUF2784 domain-containing protein [Streptosporangiaceae bacterium NEAU-GS5]
MFYRVAWETTMVVHFLVLAFMVVGGFLAWRWRRLIWLHLALCAWAIVQLADLVECPLTAVENWGRRMAGARALAPGGFIDTYIEGVVYPQQYIWDVRAAALVLVLASWAGFLLRRHRNRAAVSRTTPTASEIGTTRS